MKTKLKNAVLSTMLFALRGAAVYAAETYSYKCEKCGIIITFDKSQGDNTMKCSRPNCGGFMHAVRK